MSASGRPRYSACEGCMRRSWLLSELSAMLDYAALDGARLHALLELDDGPLLDAVAGRRRDELRTAHSSFEAGWLARGQDDEMLCSHASGYPRALRQHRIPPLLHIRGGSSRLTQLLRSPVVAIVGSNAPSDYGMQVARGLARAMGASGVTVACGLSDGIAISALLGVLDAGAGAVAVVGAGLDRSCPARRRGLYRRLAQRGCVLSELPCDCSGRRWGQRASDRILTALAELTLVVEAQQNDRDLAPARLAQALGRGVAAIPGRVTSPLSAGPHALLAEGAAIVRGPEDLLELLHSATASLARVRLEVDPTVGIAPRLRWTLEQVGAGRDTPSQLSGRTEMSDAELLWSLSELELMGLLTRGHGGRYLPCAPLPAARA
jgi:DNA processing protein